MLLLNCADFGPPRLDGFAIELGSLSMLIQSLLQISKTNGKLTLLWIRTKAV